MLRLQELLNSMKPEEKALLAQRRQQRAMDPMRRAFNITNRHQRELMENNLQQTTEILTTGNTPSKT